MDNLRSLRLSRCFSLFPWMLVLLFSNQCRKTGAPDTGKVAEAFEEVAKAFKKTAEMFSNMANTVEGGSSPTTEATAAEETAEIAAEVASIFKAVKEAMPRSE